MIFENLRKKLDSNWIKKNNIGDILVYGSYVRGKADAKDIDIAILLHDKLSANKKLLLCQQLRKSFGMSSLDVKAVDINDFLDPGFLAREGILAEGRSLLKKDYLAQRFGFEAVAIVEYSLKHHFYSEQKMLYYALQGRTRGTGILAKLNGRLISNGVLEVPTKNYEEIKDLLNEHNAEHKTTFMLKYRFIG